MRKEDLDFLNLKGNGTFSDAKVSVYSKSFGNVADVVNELKAFSPSDGWISYQSSSAERVKSGEFDRVDEHMRAGEHIIAGEFCTSSGKSLSVRFDGENWNLFFISDSDSGIPCLKKRDRQLSKLGDNSYINYSICYVFDKELGYRSYCSAFIGFTEERS